MSARRDDMPASERVRHPALQLSVIVPAYRCGATLRACADGLRRSSLPHDAWELLVVDDGSNDDTSVVAAEFTNHVLTVADGPRGPANARNVGAQAARGDVLVFVDADVVVAPNTLSAFATLFTTRADVTAAFGAYDNAPAATGFISQYRNLLHRFVHVMNAGSATTFWAGCGAVRRDAFLTVGGFDSVRYPRPQIEDIDLGYRLTDGGYRILVAPELEGSHLKQWTFTSMIRTDFRDRAVPWMHLLLDRNASGANGTLNITAHEKLLTVLTCASVLSLVLAIVFAPVRLALMALTALMLVYVVVSNIKLIRWFARERGWAFAMGAVPLRVLYYLTGGAGAAWAMLTHRAQPTRNALPALRTARGI